MEKKTISLKKMKIIVNIFSKGFLFLLTCWGMLQANESTSFLINAEFLFDDCLYEDALQIYEAALLKNLNSNHELDLFLRNRIAACYLNLHEDLKARQILEKSSSQDKMAKYLLSIACCGLKQYSQAVAHLDQIDDNQDKFLLQSAISLFYLGNRPEAAKNFKTISKNGSNAFYLAQLYLVKIDLLEGQYTEAEALLTSLKNQIPVNNVLHYEIAYWQGILALIHHDDEKAIAFFEDSLPSNERESCEWRADSYYYIGYSCLEAARKSNKVSFLQKAEQTLIKGADSFFEERFSLALAELYLFKSEVFSDENAKKKAFEILKKIEPSSDNYFVKGVIDYQNALDSLKAEGNSEKTNQLFDQAIDDFSKAFAKQHHPLSLKYQALAYYHQKDPRKKEKALSLLRAYLTENKNDETALFLMAILETKNQHSADLDIKEPIVNDQLLMALGAIYFNQAQFEKAEEMFYQLVSTFPSSSYKYETLLCSAKCAEQLNEDAKMKSLYQRIYSEDPDGPFAAEAYFNLYRYKEYLQGDRLAIKHLNGMKQNYPDSPLLIQAFYIQGLDFKKDHLTEEGKIIRRKNLLASVEAFENAEELFTRLLEEKLLSEEMIEHYIKVKYRATLERALVNMMIAEESEGAKRQIYLKYAQEVLETLQREWHYPTPPLTLPLSEGQYPKFLEETEYWLAKLYKKRELPLEEDKMYSHILAHHQKAGTNKGNLLAKVLFDKGMLLKGQNHFPEAIDYFNQANKSAEGLSSDQKLNIWIQKALCYRELGKLDQAMKVLSQVVNDESISSERVHAMYLRGEIYEQQGRHELALKQWEATSKKGGEWGQKAKVKIKGIE